MVDRTLIDVGADSSDIVYQRSLNGEGFTVVYTNVQCTVTEINEVL